MVINVSEVDWPYSNDPRVYRNESHRSRLVGLYMSTCCSAIDYARGIVEKRIVCMKGNYYCIV